MPRRNDISKILIIVGSGLSRSLAFAMALVLLSVALPWTLQACVRSTPIVKVSGDFHVIVRHEETPIAGIQVDVYDEELSRSNAELQWKPVLSLITSNDGTAEIRNLAKGRYLAAIKGPGGGYAVHVEITGKGGKLSNEVPLYWPFSPSGLLKTRSLSGALVSNDPWKPIQNVEVQLWALGIDSPLAIENTGPQGGFNFKEVRPGLYVIRVRGRQNGVEPHNQIAGDLAVELSSSAPDTLASISLRLDMTDCGLIYSACQAGNDKPFATASRRMQVLYPPGISEYPTIEGARYKLLNDTGVSIAEGTTDKNGMADLPSEAMGSTTLIVASPGLTSLQQTLDLLNPSAGAPNIAVTLSPLERCSTVTLENNATP
jgi:hypothetical protein